MNVMSMEEHDGRMDAVFLVPSTRWCEPGECLYLMIDLEQLLHPSQHIQTHFWFRTGQPVDQPVIKHIMTTQQRVVEDFEDSARCIDDCLEVGFEPNESVVRLS